MKAALVALSLLLLIAPPALSHADLADANLAELKARAPAAHEAGLARVAQTLADSGIALPGQGGSTEAQLPGAVFVGTRFYLCVGEGCSVTLVAGGVPYPTQGGCVILPLNWYSYVTWPTETAARTSAGGLEWRFDNFGVVEAENPPAAIQAGGLCVGSETGLAWAVGTGVTVYE